MRALTPLKRSPKPLSFSVYDLEWYPGTYKLRLVGVRDESGYRSYLTIAEFLEAELTSDTNGRTFFAHAGGLADVQFILEQMIKSRGSYRVDAAMSGSAAIRVSLRRDGYRWEFADSFWLFRDRLAKIGESLGLGKLGEYKCAGSCGHYCDQRLRDGFCSHSESEGCGMCIFYAPQKILETYNERDCEILFVAIERFQDELLELRGQLKRTIASTALDLFRRAYLDQVIPTCAALNEKMRVSYIASRVEPFQRTCKRARYYDFNSSFPASMMKPQPGEYVGRVSRWDDRPCDFARAVVYVPECYVPPLPMRAATGAIFFPTGRWESLFSGTDLRLLQEGGGKIERIKEVHRFNTMQDLGAYVTEIYGRRKKETDSFRKLLYKYLLNSLYGKFGEDSDKRSIIFTDAPEKLAGYPEGVTTLRPGVFLVTRHVPVMHAHVPISASITSMSRALLTRALWKASEKNSIYYADTDSIITTAELGTSDELGELKLEQTIDDGTFLAPKMYCIDGKPKVKGFPRLSKEWFDRVSGGEGFELKRMARLYEMLHDEMLGAPSDKVYTKHIRLVARPKRHWLPSGDTRPWTVGEIRAEE